MVYINNVIKSTAGIIYTYIIIVRIDRSEIISKKVYKYLLRCAEEDTVRITVISVKITHMFPKSLKIVFSFNVS